VNAVQAHAVFSDKADVARLYKELSEKEPKGIQLLVNNAGNSILTIARYIYSFVYNLKVSPATTQPSFLRLVSLTWTTPNQSPHTS
jgi:NAD(P)-dependent dehydrogenase (short-subunit alcohol dehydrogenase family)